MKLWKINDTYLLFIKLFEGWLPGHSLTNGTINIQISRPVNDTNYTCVAFGYYDEIDYPGYPGTVMIAGELCIVNTCNCTYVVIMANISPS